MDVKQKQLTCIICPIGCRISAEAKSGGIACKGNRCKKGEEFAKIELTSPKRSVTTTVRTVFKETPVLPVKTNGEVPKEIIPKLISELSKIRISERKKIGDTIIANILETGCDIIASSNKLIDAN